MNNSLIGEYWGLLVKFLSAHPGMMFLALCLLPVVCVPISPLLVLAGVVFTPIFGLPATCGITFLAMAINMSISYWLAAVPARKLASRMFAKYFNRLPDMKEFTGRNAWRLAFAVRILPGVPYIAQNTIMGLMRCPFPIFLAVSLGLTGTFNLVFVLGGGAVQTGGLGVVVIAVCLVVALWMAKKALSQGVRPRDAP